jgi:hypothetical protein
MNLRSYTRTWSDPTSCGRIVHNATSDETPRHAESLALDVPDWLPKLTDDLMLRNAKELWLKKSVI